MNPILHREKHTEEVSSEQGAACGLLAPARQPLLRRAARAARDGPAQAVRDGPALARSRAPPGLPGALGHGGGVGAEGVQQAGGRGQAAPQAAADAGAARAAGPGRRLPGDARGQAARPRAAAVAPRPVAAAAAARGRQAGPALRVVRRAVGRHGERFLLVRLLRLLLHRAALPQPEQQRCHGQQQQRARGAGGGPGPRLQRGAVCSGQRPAPGADRRVGACVWMRAVGRSSYRGRRPARATTCCAAAAPNLPSIVPLPAWLMLAAVRSVGAGGEESVTVSWRGGWRAGGAAQTAPTGGGRRRQQVMPGAGWHAAPAAPRPPGDE